MTFVIDTNVILIANRQHEGVSEDCILACVRRLDEIRKSGRVAIDDGFRIIKEYQNKTEPNAGRRDGDAFVRWLFKNMASPERCDQVHLTEHPQRGFASFPADDLLANFDDADRKFVAVAAAHGEKPPIIQASDSKWLGWTEPLASHGIVVEYVCTKDIQTFADNKKKKKARKASQR